MRTYLTLLLISTQLSLFSQPRSVSDTANYSINSNSFSGLSSVQHYSIKSSSSCQSAPNTYSIARLDTVKAVSPAAPYFIKNGLQISSSSIAQYYSIGAKTKPYDVKAAPQEQPSSPISILELPKASNINENTYVLIIGNEDYSTFQPTLKKEQNVDFAISDARLFKELCIKTLGVPNENIIYLENAGFIKMKQAIAQLNLIGKHQQGKANLVFYYAGHGLPDELTKTPYVIPVDVPGSSLEYAISLPSIYQSLTEFPSNKVIVFLDACFTGDGRNLGLVSSRGVKVKPKQDIVNGNNLVVFSSSNSEQASLPYRAKEHGLFTYYLVNKYIENKGNVTLGDLESYLYTKVSTTSILVNKTEQVPAIFFSPNISDIWRNWKLN